MKKIDVITQILEELEYVELTLFLRRNKDDYRGEIIVIHRDEQFLFEIKIPQTYPLSLGPISILFYPKSESVKDCNHVNLDGSVCLHPDKSHLLKEKLLHEIELLKEWIELYYFQRIEEGRKEYLLYPTESPSSKLLFTDIEKKFEKYNFGEFDFFPLEGGTIGLISSFHRILKDKKGVYKYIESIPCQWSQIYTKIPNQEKGLWVYIEDEPVRKGFLSRKIVLNWNELESYFNESILDYILNQVENSFLYKLADTYYYLLIGYKMEEEVHWQLVKLPTLNLPIKKEIKTEGIKFSLNDTPILWGNTENASYGRFFGRGKLSDRITEKKILIVGAGALGSTLAVYLTRGGAKNLEFIDFDIVGIGNVCRSEFDFINTGTYKVNSLRLKLLKISPHINVCTNLGAFPKNYNSKECLNYLNRFDYIFDCSAEMEVLYVLDQVKDKLENTLIYSFALSNDANELVCATGNKMMKFTNIIFDKLPKPKELFYEGTGCQFPTYNARNNEINMLLSTAISYINNKTRKSADFHCFIVRNDLDQNPAKITIDEY